MKNQLCCVLSGALGAGLVFCGGQVSAQEPGSAPETSAPSSDQAPDGGRRGMMDPEQQLARMAKRYNLSADQQSQLKPILVSQQQQMRALHGDASLSREAQMVKLQSLRKDSNTKIEAILNDEQKKQFEQDQQRMQQRDQGGVPGGGGPPSQQ